MTAPPASVIVVSRHRAAALTRCLTSLTQQDHARFEVIVVADPAGITAAQTLGLPLKLIPYDQANISAARNLGLAQAGGRIVAFIDDDAVAEPTWLSRLTAAFDDPQVIAATGFIRGRNGISYQWQACEVDALGADHPLPPRAATFQGTPQRAIKTQGTNCAFRRDTLAQIGGFDPALRFFLDEADVNLRMANLGQTAIVPEAQVHHGYRASARRDAARKPLSLHEIAASAAVFLRRHAPDAALAETVDLIEAQRSRITHLQHVAQITRAEADALHQTLAEGWDDGMARPLTNRPPLPAAADFTPLPGIGPRAGIVIAGRIWQKARLMQQASAALHSGKIVTVLCFAPSPRAHKMQFLPSGIWLQSGGLFGWSTRQGSRLRLTPFAKRIAEEIARIAPYRPT